MVLQVSSGPKPQRTDNRTKVNVRNCRVVDTPDKEKAG